jgi:hypothetical protein
MIDWFFKVVVGQALAEILIVFLAGVVFPVLAALAVGISLRELWQGRRWAVLSALVGAGFFVLVVAIALLALAGGPEESVQLGQNAPSTSAPGPTPTRADLMGLLIPTITPSPTLTSTPTFTPTPSPSPTSTPTPTPSPTLTPTDTPSPRLPGPGVTPTPACFESAPFYFERPRFDEKFSFGSSIPIIVRINSEMMRAMNYSAYSLRYTTSPAPKHTSLESGQWEVIAPRIPLSTTRIETVWTPPKTGTFWLSVVLYWDSQYEAKALGECAVRVVVH